VTSNGKARSRTAKDKPAPARGARELPSPTIHPPEGTAYPQTKFRVIAMMIDIFVLLILLSLGQFGSQAVASAQKPEVVDRIEELNDQIDQKTDERNAADDANDDARADALDNEIEDLEQAREDEGQKLSGFFIGGIAIAFFVGFLYLAIPSALTGRTLGKRTQKLKLLKDDGSPPGVRASVVRYGLLMLATFVLFSTLQIIGAAVVLFAVTMWTRNPNRQGLHDRIAHTIVVTDDLDRAGGKQ
jgi:hypothetical protein